MEVTIRTSLPRFTDEQVAHWYHKGIPFWEMIAVAIEAFRQPNSQGFFTETLCVMSMLENGQETIQIGEQIWTLINPWLVELHRKCPAFYEGTVINVDMFCDDRSLNIQLYVEGE